MAEDIKDILELYGSLLRRYLSEEELIKTYGPVYQDWKESKENNYGNQ